MQNSLHQCFLTIICMSVLKIPSFESFACSTFKTKEKVCAKAHSSWNGHFGMLQRKRDSSLIPQPGVWPPRFGPLPTMWKLNRKLKPRVGVLRSSLDNYSCKPAPLDCLMKNKDLEMSIIWDL